MIEDIRVSQRFELSNESFPLGRKRADDTRDKLYRMVAVTTRKPLPRSRFHWAQPALNQGNVVCRETGHPYCTEQGFCVGAAWKAWMLCTPLRTRTGPELLAIYHEAQENDEWPGNNYAGTSVRAGAKVLQAKGHIESYVWAQTEQELYEYVLLEGSVVVGTPWMVDMFWPDANGYVYPNGEVVGGHAYLVVGYSDHRGAYRILNSWGEQWGQHGRAWISRRHMKTLVFDLGGEACAAIERKVKHAA